MADGDHLADRIVRLEEALLFAERRVDELHEEVLALGERLERAVARVAALERSREAEGAAEAGEPSAGDEGDGTGAPA